MVSKLEPIGSGYKTIITILLKEVLGQYHLHLQFMLRPFGTFPRGTWKIKVKLNWSDLSTPYIATLFQAVKRVRTASGNLLS